MIILCLSFQGQIQDYKVNISANQVQRTQLVQSIRLRKDGGQLIFPDDDCECCKTHVSL
jgi:hypothetical protein